MTSDDSWLLRAGGLSALAICLGYVAIIALYVPMGAPPSGTEARLAFVAANTKAWWAILWLSVLTDVLFLPVAFALFSVLKEVNRAAMVYAAAFIALFVVLDLAITWTNYAALIALSGIYSAAKTQAEKLAVVASATYPAVLLESSLLFVYNSLSLAIGILIAGWVMLRGRLGKAAAYLAIATGVLGIVSVAGPPLVSALGPLIIVTSIFTTVWMAVLGYKLLRLSGPSS